MRIPALIVCLALPASAGECRVLVDCIGCRTRQLAVARCFELIPGVEEVAILPRGDSPAPNQRYLVIRSADKIPSHDQIVEALGKRAKYYRVVSVEPEPATSAPRIGENGP